MNQPQSHVPAIERWKAATAAGQTLLGFYQWEREELEGKTSPCLISVIERINDQGAKEWLNERTCLWGALGVATRFLSPREAQSIAQKLTEAGMCCYYADLTPNH